MNNIDVKWNFIITVIKLLNPKDVTYEVKSGAVYRYSKFIDLCDWARNPNE